VEHSIASGLDRILEFEYQLRADPTDPPARAFLKEARRQQLASKEQDVAVALANIGGNPDIPLEQHPMVQHAQAALDRAELNLSYTEIHAPENGIVTKVDQLQVGDYVNAGTPLFSLMSTDQVWVEANFKETELTHMRPGQEATVEVDTYPDTRWEGTVESISPAAAQEFSLLPAQNTSGNWVKVVQRIPIRVRVDTSNAYQPSLRAGMSVEVDVDTGHARGWPHFLAAMLGDSAPACVGRGPCREPLPSPQAALFDNRQGGR